MPEYDDRERREGRGEERREERREERPDDRDRDRDKTVIIIAEDCHERCEWDDDEWRRHRHHRREHCRRDIIECERDVFNLVLRNPYAVLQSAADIFADQRKKNHRRAVEDALDLLELVEDIRLKRGPEVGRFS